MPRPLALKAASLCLVIASTSAMAAEDPKAAPVFRSGFAERDITPDIGMEAPGGYGKSYHRVLHDPCKVRASVFDDGRARVAIVGIDAIGIRRDTVQKVRRAIEEKTGIPAGSILIGASHSHSSGPCVWTLPNDYDDASPLVQDLAYKQSTIVDPKYLAMVENALIDAVCAANDHRAAARAGVGKGVEKTVAFNRRFLMRDGRAITHPGLGNPDIVEPAGPVDPEVGVIGVWDAKDPNKLIGCVVNFACHATTSPGGISANFIYYLEKAIQGYYGKDAVVVFLAGASGDVTQVDNQSPYQHPGAERWAQIVGGKVGAEALKVLLTMEPGTPTPVAAKTKVWEIPRRPPAPERARGAWRSSGCPNPRSTRPNGPSRRRSSCSTPCSRRSRPPPSRSRPCRSAGGLRHHPRGILLQVRPGDQGRQRLTVHLPRLARERLRRLRPDRGRLRPQRWRLRGPA